MGWEKSLAGEWVDNNQAITATQATTGNGTDCITITNGGGNTTLPISWTGNEGPVQPPKKNRKQRRTEEHFRRCGPPARRMY